MLNHIHLIAKSDDMIGFVRDFKTFTSKELKKNILTTEPNILKLFEENGRYQFWQKTKFICGLAFNDTTPANLL